MKTLEWTWILGSLATFAIAAWLWENHENPEAAALILISPFPCPTGLPC